MKTRVFMTLATVTAGLSVAACSPTAQSVRYTDQAPTYTPYIAVNATTAGYYTPPMIGNPAGQNTPPYAVRPAAPPVPPAQNGMPNLSLVELRTIGDQIFQNEGGSKIDNLVSWNAGENFASMGIGHFTWYPAGQRARFGSTFPDLLNYLQTHGVALPSWLQQSGYQYAPWQSRNELIQARNSPKVQELQNLLYQTRLLQAQYIVERTRHAMPKLVTTASPQRQAHVNNSLNAVANTPGGWYALIDYTNFKGEGLGGQQGWGLLQVLEEMHPAAPGQQALHEFADAAMRVLERRVHNSPGDARWLAGWSNRVNTYRRVLI